MRYLCPKHQQAVWLNPKLAMILWDTGIRNGVAAYERADWQVARRFLGTAYEIALLYLRNTRYHSQGEFTVEHLVDAGRPLARVLRALKLLDEAETCLLALHDSLLQLSNRPRRSSSEHRELALQLTDRHLGDLVAALQLQSSVDRSVERDQAQRSSGHLH